MTITLHGDPPTFPPPFANELYDRMTEDLSSNPPDLHTMFAERIPAPAKSIPLYGQGEDPRKLLNQANTELGLALDSSETNYLVEAYKPSGPLARNPYDIELSMFAQLILNIAGTNNSTPNGLSMIRKTGKPYSE